MNLKIRRLVKNNTKQFFRIITGFLLLAVVFTSCYEENELGLEVLPSEDLINVKEVIISDDISTFNFTEEHLISSGGTSLLGSLNDPQFGSTKVDFAAQYRIVSYPRFGTNTVVDSVRLYLYYKNVYGDTITSQHLSVYEMEESLNPDIDYTQDVDLKSMASDVLIGEIMHTPKIRLDTTGNSIDTAYQAIVIPIDDALGEKLVNIDSTILINIDSFLQEFKGLFVESEKITNDVGAVLTLETGSISRLVVYYNNDENMAAEERDTMYTSFIITDNSVRVNHVEHDYTNTSFYPELNQVETPSEYLFVQPTGGLKSLVLIDNLETWKDSVIVRGSDTIKYGINKAELVFRIDTIATDMEHFAPPNQLLFTFIDENGDEKLLADYYFNPNLYGGFLNSNYEYRFIITQHMQAIIDGSVSNHGFYLSTGRRTHYANRVILRGSEQPNDIKMLVTYSTFLE